MQTSRIQVKKGPNGVDYEYEYVYYYYDDDEKEAKKTAATTTERIEKDVVRPTGKTRYTSVDRTGGASSASTVGSSTTKPVAEANEIPSSRGKGRQVIPVVEDVAEERLPANTRFPPRNPVVAAGAGAATPSISVVSTVDETTKKISVKRPSLELVDSHSFSRGDKTKGARNNDNNEFAKSSSDKSVIPLSAATLAFDANESAAGVSSTSTSTSIAPPTAPSNEPPTTLADEWSELTTQIMDRVALDLYAHLVNENSIADATTVADNDDDDIGAGVGGVAVTTDSSGSTASPDNEYTTYIAPVSSTTTTTTTTEAPTTTTTTTTTEVPLVHGRKSPFGGRNRFRLRPIASTPATETAERKEAATEASALKPKST